MQSPWHLLGTLGILASLALGVGLLLSSDPAGAPPSTSPSGTNQPRASQSRPNPSSSFQPAAAPAAAIAVGLEWAKAWSHHPEGLTREQWLIKLAPLTTEEFLPQLETVDLAKIPASTVTGPPEASHVTARAVDLYVPTDTVRLHLTVIATPAGWRVSELSEAG